MANDVSIRRTRERELDDVYLKSCPGIPFRGGPLNVDMENGVDMSLRIRQLG